MPVPLSDRPARWRATLAGPRPVTGMWVASGSPVCAEVCAGAGFDWLLIDSEHAPNDLRSILPPRESRPASTLSRPTWPTAISGRGRDLSSWVRT